MAHPPIDDAETGRIAGFGAGMVAGAQIGTVVIPIPIIGTITGALVGATLGSKLGQRIAPAVLGTYKQLVSPPPAGESELVMSIPSNAILITREPPETQDEAFDAEAEQLTAEGIVAAEELDSDRTRSPEQEDS